MRRDTRTKVTIVVVVALVAVVAWLVSRGSAPRSAVVPSPSPSVSGSVSPTPKAAVRPSATPAGAPMPQSYADALTTYASRRMQFDQYCQAQPSRISIARGQSVMLDNRSGDTRTFAVGGIFFTLPGYGWKIFTPYVAAVPATVYVDCGSARNVGTMLVQ